MKFIAEVRLIGQTKIGSEVGVEALDGIRTHADATALVEASLNRIGTDNVDITKEML